jgi:AcrR family transcriptional regulator
MADSPKPRGNKRERTRAALIDAALAVIDERGFAGASLEAIAERAGVTRGAIYSNFAGREALLMEAAVSRGMRLERDFARPLPLKAQLRRFAEALWDQFPVASGGGGVVIEYQLYAMTQPALRAQLAAIYQQMFAKIATDLEAQYRAELALAPHALALAVQALAMGLVWQFMLTPREVTRTEVLAAFDALADGALQRN